MAIDLPQVIKLVEAAFKKLPIYEEGFDEITNLDEALREITSFMKLLRRATFTFCECARPDSAGVPLIKPYSRSSTTPV